MRKVRDYDAELRALGDKARSLKARKMQQLGELVTATGADILGPETLAGLLLSGVAHKSADAREAWRAKGAAFFQRRRKNGGTVAGENDGEPQAPGSGDAPGRS